MGRASEGRVEATRAPRVPSDRRRRRASPPRRGQVPGSVPLLKGIIPTETNGKKTFRRGPHRPVTQFDRHPTCHLATQQRPLGTLPFQG